MDPNGFVYPINECMYELLEPIYMYKLLDYFNIMHSSGLQNQFLQQYNAYVGNEHSCAVCI